MDDGCCCSSTTTSEQLTVVAPQNHHHHHQRRRSGSRRRQLVKLQAPSSPQHDQEAPQDPPAKPSPKPVNCNLDRFLESTCPAVRAQYLPKSCQWETCRKRQQHGNVENLPYFILGDLWDCFDEWSAYGAGVPITLKGQQLVVQYYVPYLSALQLYTRSMKRPNLKRRGPASINDSDCCSVVGSVVTGDNGDDMAVPDCRHCQCGTSHSLSEGNAACCGCDKFKKICELDLCSNSEEDESCSRGRHDRNWHGHLLFEYFESSPPYARVPLSDKISQFAADLPELKSLRSVDLLPASWMSIAWYPIYRIPTGPTLGDLEACFLTFHSLSTSLQDGEPSGIVKPSSRPTTCAISRSSELDWEHPTIQLEAFGLAHYKLRGSIWTSVGNPERRHAASLYRCAESWLQQLHVGHPDFDFFRSHNPLPPAS